MTDDDIAKARQAIADEATGPTFISTRHGERYLDASKDKSSGWSAALDEVERLRPKAAVVDDMYPTLRAACEERERLRGLLGKACDALADAGNKTLAEALRNSGGAE